jgi:hypothetical protein
MKFAKSKTISFGSKRFTQAHGVLIKNKKRINKKI